MYGLSVVVESIENYGVFVVRIGVHFLWITARRNARRTRRFRNRFDGHGTVEGKRFEIPDEANLIVKK